MTERVPAVDGWFSTDDPPHLIGGKCQTCATYVFPPREVGCPNPRCGGATLTLTPLSRRGTVWSYTENRYAPPPPFPAGDPFEPYALAAVQLEIEGIIVLGQVAKGVLAKDLKVGMSMQLEIETLTVEDGVEKLVYCWAPAAPEPANEVVK